MIGTESPNSSIKEVSFTEQTRVLQAVFDSLPGLEAYTPTALEWEKIRTQNTDAVLLLYELYEHDPETVVHSFGVFYYFLYLINKNEHLKKLLDNPRIKEAVLAALLHDYGKKDIPLDILHSPDLPTDEQWKPIRKHPEIGEQKFIATYRKMEFGGKLIEFHHALQTKRAYPDVEKLREYVEQLPADAREVFLLLLVTLVISDHCDARLSQNSHKYNRNNVHDSKTVIEETICMLEQSEEYHEVSKAILASLGKTALEAYESTQSSPSEQTD